MASTVLNPAAVGAGLKPISPLALVAAGGIGSFSLSAISTATVRFSTGGAAVESLTEDMDQVRLKTNMANAFTLSGVRFTHNGQDYVVKSNGDVHRNINPATGNGTVVGSLSPGIGELVLTLWDASAPTEVSNWRAIAGAPINGVDTPYNTYGVTFRTATAPIRPSGFSLLGTMADGTTFNVTADVNGDINTSRVKGKVNYATGVVRLVFVSPSGAGGQTLVNIGYLGIAGVTNVYIDLVRQETLRYNAVAFTYLPLDADLLGIDPVRLPTDGKVPVFRAGELAVVGHTETTSPATASNGGTVDVGRTRLSRVRVIGNNNVTINTGYTVDLEDGVVTWTDVTGYSQPVRVEHRIEDMALIRSVDIDGTITFTRPLTHDFPEGSYVSSALRSGDLKARTSLLFDQATWDGVTFNNNVTGSAATGTFNDVAYPVIVTNAGAITERWALRFTSTTAGQIIGEHLGVIGTFTINADCTPLNPLTGEPYFHIDEEAWGIGWSIGNIVRFNTVGAMFPFWLVRTVQQGPESAADYSFQTIVRGDVDNPVL